MARTSTLGGKSSSLFANQDPPGYITNALYLPAGYSSATTNMTTTATRCYYVPLPIWKAQTFQGAACYNQAAGDTGEKIRLMVFNDSSGPSTLAKDFGEITLTAASAQRTLSSSWAANPGMYWFAFWADSATAMFGMVGGLSASAVGGAGGSFLHNFIGDFSSWPGPGSVNQAVAHYVDTAYGAAPATAVAPTATLQQGLGATTPLVPDFRLKA
jgi:hypothetical protein